ALAVIQTIASWPADLVEGRRRIRVFIVTSAALYGGINAVLQMSLPVGAMADVANTVNSAALAAVVAAICYAMMRVDGAELFPPAREPARVTIGPGQRAASAAANGATR